MQSLFRRLTHEALRQCTFRGQVLDLGGSKTSEYMEMVRKTAAQITVLNMDPKTQPDVAADLEQPLPCQDASFDTVLAINVLEHIYHSEQLLRESFRVLRPNGELLIIVPFLFQVHPSPHDFFRYTKEALERLLADQGFRDIHVQRIGTGVWSVRYQLVHNFLPSFLMAPFQWLALTMDRCFTTFSRWIGKKYTPDLYPLGYLVRAAK